MQKRVNMKVFKVMVGFILIFFAGIFEIHAHATETQEQIAQKILRFHVIANSDSREDQKLKLQVRDAVGSWMAPKLKEANSRRESEEIVQENLEEIEQCAKLIIEEKGYSYSVEATLKTVMFPVKTYGIYTFPAGEYEALELKIGEGEGHNWWCVMYPNLCFLGSVYAEPKEGDETAAVLQKVLTPEEYDSIMEKDNVHIQCRYLKFLNPVLEKIQGSISECE